MRAIQFLRIGIPKSSFPSPLALAHGIETPPLNLAQQD
jgi:hypothetical protein